MEVVVEGSEGSTRLDRVLALHLAELSRSRLKALILGGAVSLRDAAIRDPAYHVASGDTITIDVPEAAAPEPKGEDIALEIVFEDDDIVVLNKPKGLVVHPAAGHETGTLVNALIAHCGGSLSGIGGVRRPGIVHRLDKDTTGLMVVAKNDLAHASLTAQFADHGRTGPMRRGYMAFAWGLPGRHRGTVDAPIDRHPHAREKMAVRQGGREAVTHWELLESFAGRDGKPIATLLACELETGRNPSDPRPPRPYRPPPDGRRRLRPAFQDQGEPAGPRVAGRPRRAGAAGAARLPAGIGAPEDWRITSLGDASAGGFASPSGGPQGGAMTQAASEMLYITKSYSCHTGT
ncbi:RluA family pseudouridine synthase [Bradyrhizobium sp. GM7.3]